MNFCDMPRVRKLHRPWHQRLRYWLFGEPYYDRMFRQWYESGIGGSFTY